MNVNTAALALICILACCAETAQTPYPAEQTHFSAEEEGVQKPVPLPQDVLAILGKDDVVRGQLENANLSPQNIPQSWFSASEIHLSDHRKPDLRKVALINLGKDDCADVKVRIRHTRVLNCKLKQPRCGS
jgi:hypothetical protein